MTTRIEVPSTGSGGGAPTNAEYIVGATDATLSNERLVTDTATVAWDLATSGQAKANVPDDSITYAKIQNVSGASLLLGRGAGGGAGDVQEITLGTNLSMSGTTLNATGGGGGATWTEVEIDHGDIPVWDRTFAIVDGSVTVSSVVTIAESGKTATGRADGDSQWDTAHYSARSDSGTIIVYARFTPGPIVGPRILQYTVA